MNENNNNQKKEFVMTEKDFNTLTNNVQKILDLLEGKGMHKNSGILDAQCRHEKRLNGHDRILWMLAGAIALVSALFSFKLYIPII